MKDIVQGKPWAHPTHPMLVHFPTALYPVALVFDAVWTTTRDDSYLRSATILLGLGLAAALPAAITGLVDWAGMVQGSTKRRAATLHLVAQAAAQLLASGAFVLHLVHLRRGDALSAVAVSSTAGASLVTLWGNWLGGKLVYRMAMRVGGKPEPSPPTARERPRADAT